MSKKTMHPRRLFMLATASVICSPGVYAPLAWGEVTTIAVTGAQAPGLPAGAKFNSFSEPQLNNSGQVVFSTFLQTGSGGVTSANDVALYHGLATAPQVLAREGNAAPGVAGATFLALGVPVLSDNGAAAFTASLAGSVTASTDTGLWAGTPAALTLVEREGSAAPDTGSALFAGVFAGYGLSDSGELGFGAVLSVGVGGVTSANDVGVWVGAPGDLQLVAREGSQAPDTPAGAVFSDFSMPPAFSSNSVVAFVGTLSGGGTTSADNTGVWAGTRAGIHLVSREGDQAPGATAGAVFATFFTPSVNAVGQVAYLGTLSGSVTTDNDRGIWAGTPGSLVLAAREGSQPPGVPAGAQYDALSGAPVINSAGQIAFLSTLKIGPGGVHSGNNQGIWAGAPNSLQLVARTGSQVPGLSDGAVFSNLQSPALNANGQLLFRADLLIGAGGVTASNDNTLYLADTTGDMLLVVRSGDPLAGKIVASISAISGAGTPDAGGGNLNDFGQVVYEAQFTDGTEGLFLFTPQLHFRRTTSGTWATKTNWTVSILPAEVHSVFIDPAASLTVTGPAADTTIKSLQIGGGTGLATLSLQAGAALSVSQGPVVINGTGNLTGDGVINSAVNNFGTISSPTNLTITGLLTNHGVISGSGRITAPITNASDGEVRIATGQRLLMADGGAVVNSGRFDVMGGELEVQGILSNSGPIDIIGGTLRTGIASQNNTPGVITARDARLFFINTFVNAGMLGFSFGTSDVFGSMLNSGKVILSGNSQTTFYGAITNNPGGELRVSSGSTAVFFAAVSNSGLISGGGTKIFEGGGSGLGPLATLGSTIVEAPASVTASFIRENSLTVNGLVTINSGGGTSHLNQLNIDPVGVLDLKNNSLVLENGDLQAITAQIRSGLNSGTGILSTAPGVPFRLGSMSNAGTIYDSFQGISGLNGDEVLIRYTRIGDLNLDGTVTISDFIDLASNFNHVGGATWQMGDVNYDGSVTISDFIDLASNFNQSVSGDALPISPEESAMLAQFAADHGASAVPEPSTLLLGILFAAGARRRYLKRC